MERKDTRVMFMRASADTPEAIQQTWAEFETAVGLKGRKFFGAADVGSHEYRVCAQLNEGDDPQVNIETELRVLDAGVSPAHTTAGGIDVGGMQFWVFEDGTRLYYSPGLSISVSQDAI